MSDRKEGIRIPSHKRNSSELDRDPHKFTAFPEPGNASPPPSLILPPKSTSSIINDNANELPSNVTIEANAPQSYWMPDNVCKVCHHCEIPFSLFRRRHHCRLCGKIFCYACSSQSINGTEHRFDGPIRVCDSCFEASTVRGTTCTSEALSPLNSNVMITNSLSSTAIESELIDVQEFSSAPKVSSVAQSILPDADFLKSIYTHCLNAATEIDLSNYRESSLNILSYSKVQLLPINSNPYVIDGVVCRKNVAHKNMPKKIRNPRILILLDGIISPSSNIASLDLVLEQEVDSMAIIVSRIKKLEPDIVIAHKSVSRDAQEALGTDTIALILNVELALLERIARQTSAVVIKSLEVLMALSSSASSSNVLGTCEEFSVQKIGKQTYLFFEGCTVRSAGCTIIVNEDKDESKVERLVFVLHNLYLEMHVCRYLNVMMMSTNSYDDTIVYTYVTVRKTQDSDNITQQLMVPDIKTTAYYCNGDVSVIDFFQKQTAKISEKTFMFQTSDFRLVLNVDEVDIATRLVLNDRIVKQYSFSRLVKLLGSSDSTTTSAEIVLKPNLVATFRKEPSTVFTLGNNKGALLFDHDAFKSYNKTRATQLLQNARYIFESFKDSNITSEANDFLVDIEAQVAYYEKHSKSVDDQIHTTLLRHNDLNLLQRRLYTLATAWNNSLINASEDSLQDFLVTEGRPRRDECDDFIIQSEESEYSVDMMMPWSNNSSEVAASSSSTEGSNTGSSSWKTALEDLVRSSSGGGTTDSTAGESATKLAAAAAVAGVVKLPKELQAGCPELPKGNHQTVTFVYPKDSPASIISYSLNSEYYHEQMATTVPAASGTRDHDQGSSKHIKHAFSSTSGKKFICTTYFAKEFEALRDKTLCGGEAAYKASLSLSSSWATTGGKSGATFSRSLDKRFVVKAIRNTEFQSFLTSFSTAFFQYDFSKSLLAKIYGIYQVSYRHNDGSSFRRIYAVMENVFYNQRDITRVYDLKGRSFIQEHDDDGKILNESFVEYTKGHAIPLEASDFRMMVETIGKDTAFLEKENLIDYSLLLGISSEGSDSTNKRVVVVGIIDYLCQFDFVKRMESVGKTTVGMIAGSAEAPTIVQPSLYRTRFNAAIVERYFMPVVEDSSHK